MKTFEQVFDFFAGNRMSLDPGAPSYIATFGVALVLAIAATVVIVNLMRIDLYVYNVRKAGLSGIVDAFHGQVSIRRERVVSVVRRADGVGYNVTTVEGRQKSRYLVLVSDKLGTEDFKEAEILAGGNKELFDRIRPDSCVKAWTSNNIFTVYLNIDKESVIKEENEIRFILNKYFRDEYNALVA